MFSQTLLTNITAVLFFYMGYSTSVIKRWGWGVGPPTVLTVSKVPSLGSLTVPTRLPRFQCGSSSVLETKFSSVASVVSVFNVFSDGQTFRWWQRLFRILLYYNKEIKYMERFLQYQSTFLRCSLPRPLTYPKH